MPVASRCRDDSRRFFLSALMSLRLSTALTVVVVASSTAWAQSTDSTSRKSTLAGVYTEEQATKGDSEHQANCVACHGAEKYSGEKFVKDWVGRTAFDLFDQLKATMPDDNPGGLSTQQYTDIIAYIFKVNGLPSGTTALPADPEALRLIKIEMKAPGQGLAERRKPSARQVATTSAIRLSAMYHPHSSASPSAKR